MHHGTNAITYPVLAIHSHGYAYTIYEPDELRALYRRGAIWNVGDGHVRRYMCHRGFGENVVAVAAVERHDWILRDDDGHKVDPSDVTGQGRKVRRPERNWCRERSKQDVFRRGFGPRMAEVKAQQCLDDWPEHRSMVLRSFTARDRGDPYDNGFRRIERSWKRHRRFQRREAGQEKTA